jgi:hypothetical protein
MLAWDQSRRRGSAGNVDAARANSSTPTAARSSQHKRVKRAHSEQAIQERSRPLEAAAAARQPKNAAEGGELRTGFQNQTHDSARCEPSAMRMAISCTREATEKAMTL